MLYKFSCHCRTVEIELITSRLPENLVRCNCSICKRRGAVMMIVDEKEIKVSKGIEKLSVYQFHTKTAKHYFCSICGIYTHHQTRTNTSKYGINIACIDENNSINLKNIKEIDGKNHPLDK